MDSIGDFLTIIRNGFMLGKAFIVAPCSNIKLNIVQVLKNEGFIKDFSLEEEPGKKKIKVFLKYSSNGESAIHELTRLSRPGRRYYEKSKGVKPVIGKLGISILTTNKGVMTDKQARTLSVGGEVICSVW